MCPPSPALVRRCARAAWLARARNLLQRLHASGDDHLLSRALHLRALAAAGERQQAAQLAQQLVALEATRPCAWIGRS
ncbi:MAG: hypothetical protein ACLFS2_08110 [Halochromatium sp.]|uniref:hypothetical protein n=1 Tax=Halochromatium sp. TaxID=2049430 RepID=UPI00397BA19B